MKSFIQEPAQSVEIYDNADVLVVGGGPAGLSAAVSAARLGAKTLLLERYGHLGGMATGGLVLLIPHISYATNRSEITGMNREWVERLKSYDGAFQPSLEEVRGGDARTYPSWQRHLPYAWNTTYPHCAYAEPEILKIVLNEMATEAGVKVCFHTWSCKAFVQSGAVKGVFFESKEGRRIVLADVVIDATGDGDIFASAGAEYSTNTDKSLRNNMMAVVFRFGNVDYTQFAQYKNEHPEGWQKHLGALHDIGGFRIVPTATVRNDVIWVNNYVPGYDCLKVEDLTEVEFLVRRQMLPVLAYLREKVPGFKDGFLMDSASQIGTRGSRLLKGEYTVTYSDLQEGKEFCDVIAVYPRLLKDESSTKDIQIPYRALIPNKVEGLIAAGRCFSSDMQANSCTNLIHHCVAMGQAAGTAAAIAADNDVKPRDVNVGVLQSSLKKQGVYLQP